MHSYRASLQKALSSCATPCAPPPPRVLGSWGRDEAAGWDEEEGDGPMPELGCEQNLCNRHVQSWLACALHTPKYYIDHLLLISVLYIYILVPNIYMGRKVVMPCWMRLQRSREQCVGCTLRLPEGDVVIHGVHTVSS